MRPAVGEHVTVRLDRPPRPHPAPPHRHASAPLGVARSRQPGRVAEGLLVGPDKLTFDFHSAALTPQQVRDIERLVNERIVENAAVTWIEVPYAEVRTRKDVMQFFGDKYGETVRVVQIGGAAAANSTATRWNSAPAPTPARPARSVPSASRAKAR